MSESIKHRSREALRLQILRGTEEEVWPAFEELMRRNMEGDEGPDPWDEKPKRKSFLCYDRVEMDAFHEKLKERLDDLQNDCDGFLKLASESTLRGAENRKKLEAIKALAPEILSWMGTGVDWARSESREREAEKKMQVEHDETVKQFKELLGIKEAS